MPFTPRLRGPAWIRSRRKRVLDLFLLTCFMPFVVCIAAISIVALLPRHKSRVLFRQKRVGQNGKLFVIHKLRTMTPEHRLTRTGNVIAILGADETPQLLYTIWQGSMALIGPRPLVSQDFSKMAAALSDQEYQEWLTAYTACRPGWMGTFSRQSRLYVAQSPQYLRARYKWDTFYYHNACFTLDILTLGKSLTMWCTPPQRLARAILQLLIL